MANTKIDLDRQAKGQNFTFGNSSSGGEANVVFEKGAQTASQVVAEFKGSIKLNTLTGIPKFSSGNSSTSAANTDDLSEGSTNKWYTDTRVRANRLDQMAAPTADVSLNSQKITNLATPTSASDAATKGYVDALKQALDIKDSVRVATTTAGTLATSFENGDTVDGVTLATGDRILIKNQTSGAENGIYTVNASGAPTRATDADSNTEVNPGMFVFVEEGTTNADSGWVLTNNGSITLGTTALTFVQFSGAGQITAGNGLTKTGNQLDVQVDDSTIEIVGDTLQVKDGGITTDKIGSDAVDLGSQVQGVLSAQKGGTGYSNDWTDGDLLIGDTDSGDPIRAKLTAGSGISVTNAGGSITIAATGSAGYQRATTVSGTQDSSNKIFTIGNALSSGSEQVFLNGQLLTPGSSNDYVLSGTTLTFQAAMTAPAATDVIRVYGTF